MRVPEADVPVRSPTPAGQQVALEGAPCQRLDSGGVGRHLVHEAEGGVVDGQVVVVGAARKLLPARRPASHKGGCVTRWIGETCVTERMCDRLDGNRARWVAFVERKQPSGQQACQAKL